MGGPPFQPTRSVSAYAPGLPVGTGVTTAGGSAASGSRPGRRRGRGTAARHETGDEDRGRAPGCDVARVSVATPAVGAHGAASSTISRSGCQAQWVTSRSSGSVKRGNCGADNVRCGARPQEEHRHLRCELLLQLSVEARPLRLVVGRRRGLEQAVEDGVREAHDVAVGGSIGVRRVREAGRGEEAHRVGRVGIVRPTADVEVEWRARAGDVVRVLEEPPEDVVPARRPAAEVHPAIASLQGDEVGHLHALGAVRPDHDVGGEANAVLDVDAIGAELPARSLDELPGRGRVAGRLREGRVVGPAAGQHRAIDGAPSAACRGVDVAREVDALLEREAQVALREQAPRPDVERQPVEPHVRQGHDPDAVRGRRRPEGGAEVGELEDVDRAVEDVRAVGTGRDEVDEAGRRRGPRGIPARPPGGPRRRSRRRVGRAPCRSAASRSRGAARPPLSRRGRSGRCATPACRMNPLAIAR